MTTPIQDELALYVIGHYDGDDDALERRVDEDPEVAQQLVAETELASLMRAAVNEAEFCPRCHDLIDGERCAACEAAPAVIPNARTQRRSMWPIALAAVTLAAALGILLAMRNWNDAPRSSTETATAPLHVPSAVPIDAPPEPPMRLAPVDQPAAPAVPKKPPTKPVRKVVALRITTKPLGVVVFLDGRYLGMTPVLARVPRSSTASRLSLQHIGYKPHEQQLAVSSDVTIEIQLEPTGAPRPHEGEFTDEQCMQCHRPKMK